jgi:Holliday junction resolvase
MKESEVQKKLMQRIVATFPGIYLRKIAQGAYSRGGILDLVGCLNGKFFSIEVKTADGNLSKLQELEIKEITNAKGLALVCYDATDFDYIITRLKEYDV